MGNALKRNNFPGVKGGVVTVKAGKKTIASKKFSADGVKTITLKKQKAGTKLTFTQTTGGKKSAPIIKTVKQSMKSWQ